MVSQLPRRSHPPGAGPRGGPRHILLRTLAAVAISLSILFLIVLWLLPALGRHGDLNALVERTIRSALSVPIRIESVETDALSEFSITRVSSVAAQAEDRFQFTSERLTVFYRPLELILGGRVRELIAHRPSLFVDLDRELSGIVRLPQRPEGSGGFQLDRFRITDGRLAVRLGGQDMILEGLELDAAGLGAKGDLLFSIEGGVAGARLLVRGELVRLFTAPGAPARYKIASAQVEVEGLHLGAVVAFFWPAAIETGGRLSLSGAASGIWPEQVEVNLSSRLREGSAAAPEAPRLEEGEGSLEVSATAFGEMDRVEFQVDLAAEADLGGPGALSSTSLREEISLGAHGEFEKKASDGSGARFKVEEARLSLGKLGVAEGSGTISLSGEEPSFDINFLLPRLPLESLDEYPLGERFLDITGRLEGGLEIEGTIGGTPRSPEVAVDFALPDGVFRLGEDIPVATALRGRAALSFPSELESNVAFQIEECSLSAPAAHLEVPALTLEGWARFRSDPSGDLEVDWNAAVEAAEIGIGPVVETPGKEPLAIEGRASFRDREPKEPLGDGSPPRATEGEVDIRLETPSFGRVSIEGTLTSGDPAAPSLDLEIRAPTVPNGRLLKTWLRDPFQERYRILGGSEFSGESSFEARLRRSPEGLTLEGKVRSSDLAAHLTGARLERVSLEVPFRIGGPAPPPGETGSIRIGRLEGKGFDLREVVLPFTLEDGVYRLYRRETLGPLFGGVLELHALEYRPGAREGERLQLSLTARDVDLKTLTPVLGLPAIPGRGLLEVKRLAWSPLELLIDGRLALDVFGGKVELGGLSIEHPGEPYRVYRLARGEVKEIDLGKVGRRFRFGIASGVLEGWIRDLVTTSSDVVAFEADLGTVRRRGVPQYLNKAAIESIHRILMGPFGAIEKLFFSKFKYYAFGFHCRLEEGRFRLQGKYRFGDVEYILYSRWYQLPRVDIINTRPNIEYDWESIFGNLKEVYQRPREPENGESR